MRLAGRRILVTGAASGIGRAVVERFVAEGARVGAIDRDGASLRHCYTADHEPSVLLPLEADVTDDAQVAAAVLSAVEAFGGLDGVVNAAGVDLLAPFADTSTSDWLRLFHINVVGPATVCRLALPELRQSGGTSTIVNISSGAGLRPLEERTAYCSSKAALVMFSKALAIDLAPYKVRVNAICPGVIDTPMFRRSLGEGDQEAALARIMTRFLIQKVGEPSDIANATLFLSCDESSQVTGSALAVDGGRTFH